MFKLMVVVVSLIAASAGAYFERSSTEGIRKYLPIQMRDDYTYRFAIRHYAFDGSVPRRFQRHYLLSGALFTLACIGGFTAFLVSHFVPGAAMLLFLSSVGAYTTTKSWIRFRRITRGTKD